MAINEETFSVKQIVTFAAGSKYHYNIDESILSINQYALNSSVDPQEETIFLTIFLVSPEIGPLVYTLRASSNELEEVEVLRGYIQEQ